MKTTIARALVPLVQVADVEHSIAKHAQICAAGLDAGRIAYPFYCPNGEFRVEDPDGYPIMIAHT